MRSALLLCLVIAFATGCASGGPQRRLIHGEKALNTDGPITRLFHSSLYYPDEIRLQHDGFLVGIEKSARERIAVPGDIHISGAPDSGLDDVAARKLLNDGKLLFVSHVIDSAGPSSRPCALYNAYAFEQPRQLISSCERALPPAPYAKAYRTSWDALGLLKTALALRLKEKRYTHLMVITMGWNTDQEEAVRNFNSMVNSARVASGAGFEPLVIGVTWPSKWVSAWLDPVFKMASFPNKAHDADELGLTWLGVLLHDTLAPARAHGIPIIAIGHSFGSRAISAAACVGPVIAIEAPIPRARLDHLINWQGAFMSGRLFNEDDKGFHYPKRCPTVGNLVLTATRWDDAVKKPFWGTYAGEAKSYAAYCGEDPAVRCATASSTGELNDLRGPAFSNIVYVDASNLITDNAFNTGGGAHSDIYRVEHGRMLMAAIRAVIAPPVANAGQ